MLEIDRAQVSDAGLYKCVAINVAGSTELTYSLQVYGECVCMVSVCVSLSKTALVVTSLLVLII